MKRFCVGLLLALVAVPVAGQRGGARGPGAPPTAVDQPPDVVRALVLAIQGRDVRTFDSLTVPHPRRSVVLSAPANAAAVAELKANPQSVEISELRPMLFQGKPAPRDARGDVPVGTTGLFIATFRGQPTAVSLVRTADGWKVDLRWLIALADLAAGLSPPSDSPDTVIRSLLVAMFKLDRQEAARYLSEPRATDFLFLSAPASREPSGIYEAAVMETPIVEIGPGEFFPLVNDRIVEGVSAPDRKVLVALFGPTEVPFVVRRVGGSWRVEAEPYFLRLMQ